MSISRMPPGVLLAFTSSLGIVNCSGGGAAPSAAIGAAPVTLAAAPVGPNAALPTKSAKRGIAYDLATTADLAALAPGIRWWYNWASAPNPALPADASTRFGVEYDPMLWNGNFNATAIAQFFSAHPGDKYLLVLNEPNVSGQAYMTPQDAAQLWPRYEAVAAQSGVKLVGPAITWGTMPGYQDPVQWLDTFYAAYRSKNANRDPRIDYLAFHWYDYGLNAQLDRLAKYQKPFWVTEFANWHAQADGAQIDTLAKQEAQMSDMVGTCERRSDVFRYAWFTGRVNPDPHFDSLLGTNGVLTPLGKEYVSLPHS